MRQLDSSKRGDIYFMATPKLLYLHVFYVDLVSLLKAKKKCRFKPHLYSLAEVYTASCEHHGHIVVSFILHFEVAFHTCSVDCRLCTCAL